MRGARGSSAAAGRARDARAGLTLLELMLAMAILGLLVGATAGLFTSLDPARRQAAWSVRGVLRAAHESALALDAPVVVRIDAVEGTLYAEALEVVGTWHFEGRGTDGAFGLDVALDGAVAVEDGFLGSALSLSRAHGARAVAAVQRDPSFELDGGFRLACAVRLDDVGGGPLVTLGSSCGLVIERGGIARGWFAKSEADAVGAPMRGSVLVVDSEPGAVAPGRWVRIAFEYDRREARLFVDGVPRAPRAETAPVWRLEGPLVLSHERYRFPGSVDALVVSTFVAGEPVRLPESVSFAPSTPAEVRFRPGGALDALHGGALALELVHDDGRTELVRVGVFGTVE